MFLLQVVYFLDRLNDMASIYVFIIVEIELPYIFSTFTYILSDCVYCSLVFSLNECSIPLTSMFNL